MSHREKIEELLALFYNEGRDAEQGELFAPLGGVHLLDAVLGKYPEEKEALNRLFLQWDEDIQARHELELERELASGNDRRAPPGWRWDDGWGHYIHTTGATVGEWVLDRRLFYRLDRLGTFAHKDLPPALIGEFTYLNVLLKEFSEFAENAKKANKKRHKNNAGKE